MSASTHTLPPQAELHSHVGGSVDSAILWSIAHEQGIRLPTKEYWEFHDLVSVRDRGLRGVAELNRIYELVELVQSSPHAMEPIVAEIVGGAYRASNITVNELRFNPMKRNRGGMYDLDRIILAALYGLERALLEYPAVSAGLILMMDRTFTVEQNATIVDKAIRYTGRGVCGVDIAGPQDPAFDIARHAPLFDKARAAGLGVTIHTGEEGDLEEMHYVVEHVRPARIGHGIKAYQDPELMKSVADQGIVLELCPSSNLNIGIVKDRDELRDAVAALIKAGVTVTVNTDGPEMHGTNLAREFALLKEINAADDEQIARMRQAAFDASFIKQ